MALAKTVERNYAKRRAEELDAEKDYLKVKSEHLYRQDYDDAKEISDYYCQKHLLQQMAWLKGEQAAIPFPLPVVNKTMPAAAKPAAIKQYEG